MKNCAILLLLLIIVSTATGDVIHYLSGNGEDVQPALKGPGILFLGGGGDVDEAYQWMIDTARGCTNCDTKVDVVVLRASGADAYNDYLMTMKGVDSVESLVITSRDVSDTKELETKVKNAEVIFFAGGDQCKYVKFFKGTLIQKAVESVYARGGTVGGSSAGLAILGEYSFDACVEADSIYSKDVIADPYGPLVSLTLDFFHWRNLEHLITDTHFQQRDRIGRLLTFMARLIQDGKTKAVWGVGVNEKTAIMINDAGVGTVRGNGPAYFILADHQPEVCLKGKPLTYKNYKIWRRKSGETFDLKHRPSKGYYLRSVIDGKITENPY